MDNNENKEALYINPYTDFGFKKLFGEEVNKDLLIDFLNAILPSYHQVLEVTFHNVEYQADIIYERKAVFDIYCQTKSGQRIIVEMQKAKINYFKDRSLFYISFPIREQAKAGIWDFRLAAIYFIAILDFPYDEEAERRKLWRQVSLKD